MTPTLYASFADIADAEKAIGALLDHKLEAKNISLIANERYSGLGSTSSNPINYSLKDFEDAAKTGITTTTGADAESGAITGAGVGLGVGLLAALASVFLPGVGLVAGGGAIAIALSGAAATAGAGALAGGVVGFLKDQGVPEFAASKYHSAIEEGGAILAISPQSEVSQHEIEMVLSKYNARDIAEYSLQKVI